MHDEAPGFLITLVNGRRLFVESEKYPSFAGDGTLAFNAEDVFEVSIIPMPPNQIQATAEKLSRIGVKITWLQIMRHSILTIEKVSKDSIIWQSVYKAKTNLVLPGAPPPNRQKFGRVK